MKFIDNGNWGLKILALALAIVIYHALKSDAKSGGNESTNDRHFFPSR